MNSRSIVLAPTVRNHGATFPTVPLRGPELPPEATTPILNVVTGTRTEGHREHVYAVFDGLIDGGKDVGLGAAAPVCGAPAHLVCRRPGAGRPALGGAVAEAEETGARDEPAGGGGKGVGAVAVGIAGGDLAGV
ncbi:unnamed protein product [Spirodela intermedia]|uniref:Uncharacterized protein n=1 Tax=Spirodela intermedia TaxID=51605 RepID=A0A7I8JS70_SPIIN|nr:unnamed protein product [Spirodela intermedia]CAA6672413.1 unnamed protein product [Spirodela intermedia]